MHARRILVVENEPIIAVDLTWQLLELGYEVPEPVATGHGVLSTIEETRPDLILMDINIDGEMDGIATASRIPSSYRIPVIYLTAHSDDSTVTRAGATRPYGYLVKPFSGRELHAMIQVTLARCRAELASHAALETRWRSKMMRLTGQLADEGSFVAWRKSESGLFASLRSGWTHHSLIVEPLPRKNAWDWTVWRPDEPEEAPRYGMATSVLAAMAAAEQAVRQWAAS
jgi:CheY-like chemotaxis protein